ncbi:MAG TPA: FUSC family protein [Stellaceae bacterium]|nr:FUSC family protein [Stellaceae bacterium]
MKLFARFQEDGLLGVRFAVNVFVGASLLWLLLRFLADANPIWAIASMIAASEPVVSNAVRMFRARIINVLVGCAVGLAVLVIGGTSEWKVPLAISIAVLISSYVVRIQTMWRQAPINAALVIASGLAQHSKLSGIEDGLQKVAEVIMGCVTGLLVTWLISRLWPLREAPRKAETQPVKA